MKTFMVLDANPAVMPLAEGVVFTSGKVVVEDDLGSVHSYESMVGAHASFSYHNPPVRIQFIDEKDRLRNIERRDIDAIAHAVATELVRDLSQGWQVRYGNQDKA